MNVGASVTGPPANYTRAVKESMSTKTSKGPEQNKISARAARSEDLMRMIELVAWMKV